MRRYARVLVAALLICVTCVLPAAAAESSAVSNPDTYTLATNEAPDSLKQWAVERERQAPRKRAIAIALIVVMTLAGATSSYLMTKRLADADRMTGDAHNRWIRDRAGVQWRQWDGKQ